MQETSYRGLRTYTHGEENWDHTDTVEAVDQDLPVYGAQSDRPLDPPTGRTYWAEDTRILWQYRPTDSRADGDGWVPIAGAGATDRPVPGTRYVENLSVSGELTSQGDTVATRRSTKTLDVLDYGDATDADAALTDAVADADPHDTLLFRDETFQFTENHTFQKPVNLRFDGAQVDDQRSNITVGATLFRWEGPGSQQETTLSNAVRPGNNSVTVDATGFAEVGDTLYLRENPTDGEPITQFAVVESVTEDSTAGTSDLTLSGVVRREFSAGIAVHRVDLWDNIQVEGAEVTATHPDGEVFAFAWCHRPRVRDVFAREIGRHTVQFAECYDPTARDCEARNSHKRGSGEGEPFICFRSTDVTWANCRTQATRRGIDLTLGTTGVTIIEPHIEDFTKGGISAHDGDAIRDVTVIGGEVHSTDPSDNACISLAGETQNVTVHGVSMVAHRQAMLLAGDAEVQAVDVELAELPSSDPELITVVGDDVSIQGDVHIPVYESYVQVADVDGAYSNVDLDLNIQVEGYNAGGNENPLIQASSGASDVTITGAIDSVPELGMPAIRLYGQSAVIENVAVDGVAIRNHGGQGVQFRGDAGVRAIRVSDSFLDVGGDGVRWYQYDNLATCENFWIRDNEVQAGGTGVNVAAAAADTVRILDNEATVNVANDATNIIRHRAEVDKAETVTGAWTFGGTLTLASDLQDDAGNVIYDYSAGHILQSALQNDTVTVAGNAVALGGSTAVAHADLSAIGTDDHHTRYSDEESQDAVGAILSAQFTYDDATPAITLDPHAGTPDAHHTRYADSEAVAAVEGTDPLSVSHAQLATVNSDDHHTRYADTEAVSAVDAEVTAAATTVSGLDTAVDNHHTDTGNPHSVTNDQVGVTSATNANGNYEITINGDTYTFVK